eukprot:COSAG02_NODE_208_length_29027_cov_27.870230_29_plen_66_part_00
MDGGGTRAGGRPTTEPRTIDRDGAELQRSSGAHWASASGSVRAQQGLTTRPVNVSQPPSALCTHI